METRRRYGQLLQQEGFIMPDLSSLASRIDDLEIIPVLMRFTPHAEIEFSLEAVDKEAPAKWIEDRLVEFVRTYFPSGENELYLKDRMVEDPIAHVRFPRDAAAMVLDWQGRKFYFIGEETRRSFAEQNKIAIA
jgi:YHS domain-containing protein